MEILKTSGLIIATPMAEIVDCYQTDPWDNQARSVLLPASMAFSLTLSVCPLHKRQAARASSPPEATLTTALPPCQPWPLRISFAWY